MSEKEYENILKICLNGNVEQFEETSYLQDYINGNEELTPPLYIAVNWKKYDIAKYLISKGADVNNKFYKGMYGYNTTLIHMLIGSITTEFYDGFIKELETDSIEFLINNGAEINKKDEKGYTPLDWTVIYNHYPAEKLLKENGGKFTKEFIFSDLYKRMRPDLDPNVEIYLK